MAKIARFGAVLALGAFTASLAHADTTQLTSPAQFSPSRTHDGFELNMPTPFFYPNGVGGTTFSIDDVAFPVPRVITDADARPFPFPAPNTKVLSTQGTTIAGSLIIQFSAPVNRIGFHVKTDPSDDLDIVLQVQGGGTTVGSELFDDTGLTFMFVGVESDVAFDQVRLDVIGTGLGVVNLDDLLFESVLDSDGDGLSDAAELDVQIDGCPDPFDPDSDDDGLLDGEEITLGTDPCNSDCDGDGVPDGIDPSPLDPGDFSDVLAEAADFVAAELGDPVQLGEFDSALPANAPDRLAETRQNTLSNQIAKASRQIEKGNLNSARDMLLSVLTRLEGENAWATGENADEIILKLKLFILALDAQL